MVSNEKNVCLQNAYEAHNEVNTAQRGKYGIRANKHNVLYIFNRLVYHARMKSIFAK